MPLKAIRLQTPADPFLNATFVSVTQQFNTTTSMGRLKLNMLLSFAQFERQIDSERIRDKIAASKKKGTWMGGNVPIGSDVKDRELIVREPEASTVRLIFRRYAELGSVSLLRVELDRLGIVSKRREGPGGHLAAGQHFSRGALYLMLLRPQAAAGFSLKGGGGRWRRPISHKTGSTIRYAIYTRKSSDEGLEPEFNSLDAQRQASRRLAGAFHKSTRRTRCTVLQNYPSHRRWRRRRGWRGRYLQ